MTRKSYLAILVVITIILVSSFLPKAIPQETGKIAWYIVPYVRDRRIGSPQPSRHCELSLYNKQIWDAGGKWTCREILGNRAIVKIKAPAAILEMIDSKYKRLPKDRLGDSLSDLSSGVKTALKNEILDMGYSLQEIKSKFGNAVSIGQFTLRDVLKFMAKRKREFRYISETDDFVCDGKIKEIKIDLIKYIDNKVK